MSGFLKKIGLRPGIAARQGRPSELLKSRRDCPVDRVFSLSLGKDVILSEAKNLTHDRETLRFAQGDNEKALAL